MKVNLQDQVALITGAAQGIGKSITEALAANGARVVLTDIDFPKAAGYGGVEHLMLAVVNDLDSARNLLRMLGKSSK